MESSYQRGSIWRKWDLHVHSPASDGYTGSWDQFYEQLQQAECSVIGINDYCSIEGYANVKEKIDNQDLDLGNKVILPVVEFRMRDVLQNRHTGRSGVNINFHIIFDPIIEIEKIRTFLKGLPVEGDTQIADRYDDKQFLKEEAQVYFEENVIKKFRSNDDFRGKFLVWLPYDEYGGIGDIDPETDDWIKRGFIRKSHILGSSNSNQISFFLWNSPEDNEGKPKFSDENFKEWFRIKKPCIKGSDSHNHNYPIGKLKDRDSNPTEKYCWIKADKTFEGLKQIVYEPESRVYIGKENPNNYSHSSIDELVVDTDKVLDKSSDQDRFFINEGEEVYFNQGLTTVIGSRGAGKSVLLDTLALSLGGKKVVAEKSYVVDIVKKYSDDAILLSSMVKGGSQGSPVSYDWPKTSMGDVYNFEYFSQKKIGEIADFRNQEDKQRLSQLIYDYVFSDYARDVLSERTKLKEDILQSLEVNRVDILNQQKTIDKKDGIESKIEELKKEKEAYTQEELSELYEKREDFRNLKSEMDKNSGRISEKLGDFDELLADYSGELFVENEEDDELKYEEIKENLLGLYVPEKLFDEDVYENRKQEFSEKLEELFSGLKLSLENQRKYLEEFNTLLTQQMAELKIDQKLEEITQKLKEKCKDLGIEFNQEIDEKRQQIEKQLNELEEKEEKIEKAEIEKEKLLQERKKIIQNYHERLDNIQKSLEYAFTEFCDNEGNVLEGSISIEFYKHNMIDECIELIKNKVENNIETQDMNFPRKNLSTILADIGLDKYIECLRSKDFSEIVLDELRDVGEGTINYLEGIINGEEVALSLEELLTSLEATIKWRGEHDQEHKPLSKCSVGEKSTAVLSIMLVSGDVPLIIDQPEEDLDNYYIWNQLSPIIKEVKKRRQLIFATHNANIVVGGDAELVLILNSSDGNSTNITPTTLEDISNRKEIINILEGGEHAFDKRRQKYGIT